MNQKKFCKVCDSEREFIEAENNILICSNCLFTTENEKRGLSKI